ncbi:hypothetical protein B566_EDAN010789 [Ephemera danica]|nr:hypothetical protein B566_EDAN010789 [Ephemera danica]
MEAFFDFIVAIGKTRLDQDNDTLKELLRQSVDQDMLMLVYSSKTQTVRQLTVRPSTDWGGQGLLGVSIRFCSFQGASENVWHVLDVQANSPAEKAGLQSHVDYIIGADSVLHESEDLFSLLEAHEGRALSLYVYNSETDSCRQLTLTPDSHWGGQGSLGCGIGFGYLHRIPIRRKNFVPAGNDTKENIDPETAKESGVLDQNNVEKAQQDSSFIQSTENLQLNESNTTAPPTTCVNPSVQCTGSHPGEASCVPPAASTAYTPSVTAASAVAMYPTSTAYTPSMTASAVPMYQTRANYSTSPVPMYPTPTSIPTYATPAYPPVPTMAPSTNTQFNLPAGMPLVTTPINLPGYPPITVSASLPPSLPLDSFSPNPPPTGQPTSGIASYFSPPQHT